MADLVAELYGNRVRVRSCGLLIENESLLMANHAFASGDFWAPPGGGVNFGEPLAQCVQREFLEETGLEIKVEKFLFTCELIRPPLHAIELFFLVKRRGGKLNTGRDPEMKAQNQIIKTVRFVTWHDLRYSPPGPLHGIFQQVTEPSQISELSGYFSL